jgi:hypothetical protein
MKKLRVTITLDMSVPEHWELATTSEGGHVIHMGEGQHLDLTMEPLFATDPEDTWSSSDDEAALNEILDLVESEDVAYEFVTH